MYSLSFCLFAFLGAYGVFKVTDDITKYCKASVFSEIGKETRVFARFSTVGEWERGGEGERERERGREGEGEGEGERERERERESFSE